MHRTVVTLVVGVLVATSAATASAQVGEPWLDRGFLNLNVGFESTSGTLTDATTFTLFGETGTKAVNAAVDSGALFDFSVGSRVWQNVSVGIGFHRGANSGDAAVTASVPNPVFFSRNRSVAFPVSELDRTERAFHLQFGYMLPVHERIDVHVFAGPSFFRVKQEVVSDVTFQEQGFPFTSVSATPTVTERSDSAVGGHIGADVTYKVYETGDYKVGAGMFLRYAGATVRVPVIENSVDSDAGGLQIGFGARLRF